MDKLGLFVFDEGNGFGLSNPIGHEAKFLSNKAKGNKNSFVVDFRGAGKIDGKVVDDGKVSLDL